MPIVQAAIGYIGYVEILGGNQYFPGIQRLRATTADLKATQTIDKPNVVDGMYDNTVYKLNPIEIAGNITFPAIMEATANTASVADNLWSCAFYRDNSGRIAELQEIDIKYYSGWAYAYKQNIVNSYEFSVTQGDQVNINVGLISRERTETVMPTLGLGAYGLRNTRIVTWNDATVNFKAGTNGTVLGQNSIRSFTITLNNNAQRYYVIGTGDLYPVDIAPTKRTIDGSIVVMGVDPTLQNIAITNSARCTETNCVTFGYTLGNYTGGCSGAFAVSLTGVVFEIETLAISNDLIESTINYHVLPGFPSFASAAC